MPQTDYTQPFTIFALRLVLTVCFALLGITTHAQRTLKLEFTDGLKTEVNIVTDSPKKLPQGRFVFYPFVMGSFGAGEESGFYGPVSPGVSYTKWSKNRQHIYEGFLMYSLIDSRTQLDETEGYIPHFAARANYHYVFSHTVKNKKKRLNFLTENYFDGYKTRTIHSIKLDVPRRVSYAVRAGLNARLYPRAVNRNMNISDPSDWYDVDMSTSSFGHVGLSRIKTFYLAYESKDFGSKQQAFAVGEVYADFLVGLSNSAYGPVYISAPESDDFTFEPVPQYRDEVRLLPFGARFGAEFHNSYARKRLSGWVLGIEIGKNPGFVGSSFYVELRIGFSAISKKIFQ
jgi:hypothetical protein